MSAFKSLTPTDGFKPSNLESLLRAIICLIPCHSHLTAIMEAVFAKFC